MMSGHDQPISPCLQTDECNSSDHGQYNTDPSTGSRGGQRRYPRHPRQPFTTNVYVHGLPPNTTDEALYNMCSAYGMIISSKSIIEPKTNLCRGYGFVMYEHLHQAQHAIYCLGVAGFEASFAKVRTPSQYYGSEQYKAPFKTKLKNLQDGNSANIYISNLPANYTEKNLESLFEKFHVNSVRILRDNNNRSRGVGFARLPDRSIAQEAIESLDGVTLEGSLAPLQVRYADSPAQKRFKSFTHFKPSHQQQSTNFSEEYSGYPSPPPFYHVDAYSGVPGGYIPYPPMPYYVPPAYHPATGAYYPPPVVMSPSTGECLTPQDVECDNDADVEELTEMVQNNLCLDQELHAVTS